MRRARAREGRVVAVGSDVVVTEPFASGSACPMQLSAGERGRVVYIDDAGDAKVRFDAGKTWVFHENFSRLRAPAQDAAGMQVAA